MTKVYCFKKVLLIVQKDKYTNRPAYISITMYVNVINNVSEVISYLSMIYKQRNTKAWQTFERCHNNRITCRLR